MKPVRTILLVCPLGVAIFLASCRSKPHEPGHAAEPAAALPVPTPDYTPIPLLRTPAGLVLSAAQPVPPTPATAPSEGTPLPQTTAVPSP